VRGVESVDKNTVIDAVLELSVMHHGLNILCKLLFVLMFTAFIHTATFLATFSYLDCVTLCFYELCVKFSSPSKQ